jgi:hypothetical protein
MNERPASSPPSRGIPNAYMESRIGLLMLVIGAIIAALAAALAATVLGIDQQVAVLLMVGSFVIGAIAGRVAATRLASAMRSRT